MSFNQLRGVCGDATMSFEGVRSKSGYIEKFASTGASGERQQNIERDMHRFTEKDMRIRPYMVKLPLKYRITRKRKRRFTETTTVWENVPFILIWEIFALLYDSGHLEEVVILASPPPPRHTLFMSTHFLLCLEKSDLCSENPIWTNYKYISSSFCGDTLRVTSEPFLS